MQSVSRQCDYDTISVGGFHQQTGGQPLSLHSLSKLDSASFQHSLKGCALERRSGAGGTGCDLHTRQEGLDVGWRQDSLLSTLCSNGELLTQGERRLQRHSEAHGKKNYSISHVTLGESC